MTHDKAELVAACWCPGLYKLTQVLFHCSENSDLSSRRGMMYSFPDGKVRKACGRRRSTTERLRVKNIA